MGTPIHDSDIVLLPDDGQVPKRCKITELVGMSSAMRMGVSTRIPFIPITVGSLFI